MYVGTQYNLRSDDDYRVLAQLGVNNVSQMPDSHPSEWNRETLAAHKEKIESFGLTLDLMRLPVDHAYIDANAVPGETVTYLLGDIPERERHLDHLCQIIRDCGEVGIPGVLYNINIIGVFRTESVQGRGGSINSSFNWEKADHDAPPGTAGTVSAEEQWERIEYFLDRVVPVAEEAKVRLACHPQDTYAPPGWRGVTTEMATVEGMKRFVQYHESPYHGLNFCQGTVSEMLERPGEEIYDVIRWFGERNKIFNVHFRNIKGGRLNFVEVFPDEGDVDMLKAARVYKEVGYPYMLMPDHVPQISGENPSSVGFAFAYGYIQALIQAVN